ncbi:MAG: DUF1707 and DUF4870 domain-containing protein [Micropruina sp.]|uniref:DUF1707 and DUF4870 domain-containing protein n=1 Tax=Micropruina sp. TaxID=2737536 RepID=UPI0039E62928
MTHDFFAPVDSVSKQDRDGAERRLREAFGQGRMTSAEFEARMSRVIMADRLDQLAAAVDGPLPIEPLSYGHRGYEPGGAVTGEVVPVRTGPDRSTTTAVLAHLSPFLLWLFGPLIIWAISPVGSYAKREAAKAFNWQLVASALGLAASMVGWLLPGDGNPVARIWTVIWVVFTVLGAIGAGRGKDWRNPVRALVPWEVLSERKR